MKKIPLFSRRRPAKPDIQIKSQREAVVKAMNPVKKTIKKKVAAVKIPKIKVPKSLPSKDKVVKTKREYIKTGIAGFDELFDKGIPKGVSILVAGGPGSGKTIFGLQTLHNKAHEGKKCLYMSFEEEPERLKEHMIDFGWEPHENIIIKKFSPFDVTTSVNAMLEKAKGELLIDIEPVLFKVDFKPDYIFIDSLSAIASAFVGKEETYRIYIEQLFELLKNTHATSFLITETEQMPRQILTKSGVEEFLADGVIVLYNIIQANSRQAAIEILKMRGSKHEKKIVAMEITGKGLVVYPEQPIYTDVE